MDAPNPSGIRAEADWTRHPTRPNRVLQDSFSASVSPSGRPASHRNLYQLDALRRRVTTRQTREIRIGNVRIGGENPIAVQSMTATRTQDIAATIRQVELLEAAGADVIRIAVDNPKDVVALAEIRAARPNANLSIDLQENYRLAEKVAPYVQKLRYNPGHLYRSEERRVGKECRSRRSPDHKKKKVRRIKR